MNHWVHPVRGLHREEHSSWLRTQIVSVEFHQMDFSDVSKYNKYLILIRQLGVPVNQLKSSQHFQTNVFWEDDDNDKLRNRYENLSVNLSNQ